MIGILLLKNIDKIGSWSVDALARRIESHVINHTGAWQRGHNFAGVRIQNNELLRFAGSSEEQAMIRFIKYERYVVLGRLGD